MIDLHLHTQASDGTWTPGETIRRAAEAGLSAVAFTDHDTLDSLRAGACAARLAGLRFVAAIEVTTGASDQELLHILGYGIDQSNHSLARVLAFNQAAWEDNERRSLANLARLGITIRKERHAYWAGHREAGGWPTYNCLRELGVVRDYRDYFARLFGPGRPAFVATSFVQPVAAIAAIRDAGGVSILAHPGAYDPTGRTVLDRPGFLDDLVDLGVEGFEAIANENDPAVTEYLLKYCLEHGLLATGGSDCHGEFAGRTLGRPPVPDDLLPPLLARLNPASYV